MKIIPVSNNKRYNPGFHSCFRKFASTTINDSNKFFALENVRNSTNVLREDLDWQVLTKYILSHFENKKRVNMLSLAGSDGSEAFSYVLSLMEKIPKEAYDKYFPVISSDIDPVILDIAKSKRINIFDAEIINADLQLGIKLRKYFTKRKEPVLIKEDDIAWTHQVSSYEPAEELFNAVQFKQSDILTELSQIKDDSNSVIFCRNVFPYLKNAYTKDVINTAKNVLNKGSLFIIGDYDRTIGIEELLEKNGFYRPLIYQNNIFQRGSIKEVTDRLNSGYLI